MGCVLAFPWINKAGTPYSKRVDKAFAAVHITNMHEQQTYGNYSAAEWYHLFPKFATQIGQSRGVSSSVIFQKIRRLVQIRLQMWIFSSMVDSPLVKRQTGSFLGGRLDFLVDGALENAFLLDVNVLPGYPVSGSFAAGMRLAKQAGLLVSEFHVGNRLSCLAFGQTPFPEEEESHRWEVVWDERWGVKFVDPNKTPPCPIGGCDCGFPKLQNGCVPTGQYPIQQCPR
eukprot:TRINITY_DN67781_c3_g1_i1.p1 TRINITY_DN67781_c3_g1~~TRINITY_DN67781_c3_g1_i1.p1  ORF type:complete len:228 (-),score=26.68 TRINITY_DN67781_c3_g1_i1:18-701(-)